MLTFFLLHADNATTNVTAQVKAEKNKKTKEELGSTNVAPESEIETPAEESKPIEAKKEVEFKIEAFTQFEANFTKQDFDKNNERGGARPHFNIGDSKVKFKGIATVADNTTADYTLRLSAQPNTGNFDRNFIGIQNPAWGRFELGNVKGPQDSMCKMAQEHAHGAGWLVSGLDSVYYNSLGVFPGKDPVAHTDIATKISWYSPVYSGFQLGVSFTPSTAHVGSNKRHDKNPGSIKDNVLKGNPGSWLHDKLSINGKDVLPQPFGRNNVTLALNYKYATDEIRYGFGGFYIFEKSELPTINKLENIKLRNARSWGLTGMFGFGRTTFGVEYFDGGKSRLPADAASSHALATNTAANGNVTPIMYEGAHEGHAGRAINFVGDYKIDDKHRIGAGYQTTKMRFNASEAATRNLISVFFTKKIRNGLSFFGEVDYIRTKVSEKVFNALGNEKTASGIIANIDADSVKANNKPNNKAWLFTVGLKLNI